MTNFFPRWRRVLLLALSFLAQAQNVGIGTTAPDASAALDVTNTATGLLPRACPRPGATPLPTRPRA